MISHALSSVIEKIGLSRFRDMDIPDRLVAKPIDPWPGNASEGLKICDQSREILTPSRLKCSEHHTESVMGIWPERFHRFFWLRDLRSLGGIEARHCAKALTSGWMDCFATRTRCPESKLAWRTDILGERIANWISHFDFIEMCHEHYDEDFHDDFLESLYMQSRVLAGHIGPSQLGKSLYGLPALKALKGLLYAGLAFEEHEIWIEKALSLLEGQIKTQFLEDGSHITRSPLNLLRGLQIMLDVKTALTSAAYPIPSFIQHGIDRAGSAMKVFRFNDKSLATMNGAFAIDPAYIDTVLAQAGARGKAMKELPASGYHRASLGRTALIFDGGLPPRAPYDRTAHAAPLSFEMTHGKDRVFVSCGSHYTDKSWRDTLRATAAHNTVCLDYRNAYEIKSDGHFSRKAQNVICSREQDQDAILLQGSHDGYLPLNGIIHERKLFLTGKGDDLRGCDTLQAKITPVKPIDIAIRFHIHPHIVASVVQDGSAALLRLPNGTGWRFKTSAGVLTLEDSVYCGDGQTIRKNKQLVIYGQTNEKHAQINWCFRKESV